MGFRKALFWRWNSVQKAVNSRQQFVVRRDKNGNEILKHSRQPVVGHQPNAKQRAIGKSNKRAVLVWLFGNFDSRKATEAIG